MIFQKEELFGEINKSSEKGNKMPENIRKNGCNAKDDVIQLKTVFLKGGF